MNGLTAVIDAIVFSSLVRYESVFLPTIGALRVSHVPAVRRDTVGISGNTFIPPHYEVEYSGDFCDNSVVDILVAKGGDADAAERLYERWLTDATIKTESGVSYSIASVGTLHIYLGGSAIFAISEKLSPYLNPFNDIEVEYYPFKEINSIDEISALNAEMDNVTVETGVEMTEKVDTEGHSGIEVDCDKPQEDEEGIPFVIKNYNPKYTHPKLHFRPPEPASEVLMHERKGTDSEIDDSSFVEAPVAAEQRLPQDETLNGATMTVPNITTVGLNSKYIYQQGRSVSASTPATTSPVSIFAASGAATAVPAVVRPLRPGMGVSRRRVVSAQVSRHLVPRKKDNFVDIIVYILIAILVACVAIYFFADTETIINHINTFLNL